jgi:CheY-like chemotaxis protein
MTNYSGLKVLIVEDEGLVALMIEDMLLDLGCEIVASIARLGDACALAAEAELGLAILDVNLAGQASFPVARILRDRNVPFIFGTGYGTAGLPQEFADRPLVGKPFSSRALEEAIRHALGPVEAKPGR